MPLADFKKTPILIICRDRLEPLRQLLEWLYAAGYERPVVIDNDSTFPPLVEFFAEHLDIEVIQLGENLGHLAPWRSEVVQASFGSIGPVVVTDCDVIPDAACPDDVVEHLAEVLLLHADVDKVGLGLRIDDLPTSYGLKDEVIAWEKKFWEVEIASGVFEAEVDTTFALYRRLGETHSTVRALRTGGPYVARHLSWYVDSSDPLEEQIYYRRHSDRSISHWESGVLDRELSPLLAHREAEIATVAAADRSGNPLLQAWVKEPPPEPEALHTSWAEPFWLAWNGMSPEVQFCDFVASLALLLQPHKIVETGVGQGFTTRRLARVLQSDQHLLVFEDDPDIRDDLRSLPFFDHPDHSLSLTPSPSTDDFADASLTVLDSEIPSRLAEIDRWWDAAPDGAVLVVHDAGNGHEPNAPHHLIRRRIETLGIGGVFLKNPRGSFLGFKATGGPPPAARFRYLHRR
jgi:hypothetical protein